MVGGRGGRCGVTGRSWALAPAWATPQSHARCSGCLCTRLRMSRTPDSRQESGSWPLLRWFKLGNLQVWGDEVGSSCLPRVPQIPRLPLVGDAAPWGGQPLALPSMLCCADSALRFHGGAARVAGQGTAQGTPEPSCIECVEPEPLAKPLVRVCREGAGGPSWTLVTKTLGALALTLRLLRPLT